MKTEMLASSEVMDALKAIGLNLYERKLWVALLSRGKSTAGELSDISGVPRSRCYDVLESLADKGFVIIQPGKPISYVAINPADALERAKRRTAERALAMAERIDRIKKSSVLKDLKKIHKESVSLVKPEDMTGALKGRFAMHDQLGSMIKKAKKNVHLVTTKQGLEELYEKHFSTLQKAAKSGVDIRIIAPIDKQNYEIAKSLAKHAKIKDISRVQDLEKASARFAIVDDDKFLMALTDDEKTHPTQDVSFWTESTHVAGDVMKPMFKMLWKNARPV
ncbi:MAG: hypothetical protein B6U68_00945 [Candidatus Aenigmarchaeota archaeon ex4484_14]|nr:MAG: hypothetical protein B6U68_00945 [Candidatus Aenigmarchaeota archaeon ex4484_14]